MKNKMYGAIEVEIAKNLIEAGYEWLATDSDETLYAYDDRPEKRNAVWMSSSDRRPFPLLYRPARGVIPFFASIRWEDDEPVRLRDIVPQTQILTDEEREWLRTVVKPFRDRLKALEAHEGYFYGKYIRIFVAPPKEWKDHTVECSLIQISKDSFTRMEDHKEYTPEELGL